MRSLAIFQGWPVVAEALDTRRREQASREQHRKDSLTEEFEKAPVLQNDIAVKKPLVLKPRA